MKLAVSARACWLDKYLKFLVDKSALGRKKVGELFKTCAPLQSNLDISTLMSNLMGNWMGTVQYNDENGNPVDIKYLCNIMFNATTPLNGYIAVNDFFMQSQELECQDVSYIDSVFQLQNTTIDLLTGVGMRQWYYQTCTEFGYYQTTDSSNQPFGNLVPLEYYTKYCRDVFGFDFQQQFIDETNTCYGGSNLPSNGPTNILFVNGNIDPWHSLSVTQDISDTVKSILISDTAHCANILPTNESDPPDLTAARVRTSNQIGVWLSQAKQSNKSTKRIH